MFSLCISSSPHVSRVQCLLTYFHVQTVCQNSRQQYLENAMQVQGSSKLVSKHRAKGQIIFILVCLVLMLWISEVFLLCLQLLCGHFDGLRRSGGGLQLITQ